MHPIKNQSSKRGVLKMRKRNLTLALLISTLLISLGGCKKPSEESLSQSSTTEPTSEVTLSVNESKCSVTLDIYSTMFVTVDLKETINEKNIDGLSFTATSTDTSGITLSNVQDNGEVNIFSTGEVGEYTVEVDAFVNSVLKLEYDLTVNVVDNSPAPTKIKDIPTQDIAAPKFITGKTNYDLILNLADYIDASDYVSYQMECNDSEVTMVMDGRKATLNFKSFGTKEVTIKALLKGTVHVTLTFDVVLTATVNKQLFNGGFEDDWSGWDADEWDRAAYSIYDSETDIWGNFVNNVGKYLYGYHDETGTADIFSSLFKVGGNGLITFLLSGNCTEDLQLRLMKYVDGGTDVEIAKFNNWYYGKYAGSGFIMNKYYYRIPSEYNNAECYFEVVDNRTADFGFIMLDEVKTHYESDPTNIDSYYQAGYKVDPAGNELDMSDTSNDPFTELSKVTYQLPNGDFESGYSNWFMTVADKEAYAIYGSSTDIWGNPVNNTKNYLYGYANEAHTTTFHSDLFKVGGTGLITFKLGGYHTSDLQFRLKKYVEDGADVEIAKFNNWYCNPDVRSHSGFIMQNYWYYIDLATYQDSYCYFEVYDMRTSYFGFFSIDDIITYYEVNPIMTEEDNYYKAGYINDPR